MAVAAVNRVAAGPPPLDHRALALRQRLGRALDPRDPRVARWAAAQLVSELFYKPVLAELRNFPFRAEFVQGGQTESAFGALLEERLADAAARTTPAGLVERVAEELAPGLRRRGLADRYTGAGPRTAPDGKAEP